MKKISVLCFLLLAANFLALAQTFTGIVLDDENGKGIVYASIGIKGKKIGTVTDKNGAFSLNSEEEIKIGDTLIVSHIGYKNLFIPISDLIFNSKQFGKLLLEIAVIDLPEIELTKSKLKGEESYIGNGENIKYAYYIGIGGKKGAEIGTLFTNKDPMILKEITIGIASCEINQKKYKLNIYTVDEKEKAVIKTINTRPIIFEVQPKHISKGVNINLSSYNIEINSSFLVSVQEILGSDPLNPEVMVFGGRRKIKSPCLVRPGIGYPWEFLNSDKNGGIAMFAKVLK